MIDIGDTIQAKSDQWNAADLLGGPITVTIAGVDVAKTDQPVTIHLEESPGKAYRPSKGMRRALVKLWGPRSADYAGRRLTLFNEPSVKWAGQAVGGIQISHASHIDKPVTFTLATAKGKLAPITVQPLPDAPPQYAEPAPIPTFQSADEARAYWMERRDAGASPDELTAIQQAATAIPANTTPEESA